jgi:hypothetical protein
MNRTGLIYLSLILFACAGPGLNEDPLKNTKKLMKEGHVSLYENGAFQVPLTKVKLIPPGPETSEIVSSLAGVKSKAAFLHSLNEVMSTHQLVKAGTLKSWDWAGKIRKGTGELSLKIGKSVADDSLYVLKKSSNFPQKSLNWSILLSRRTRREMNNMAERLKKVSESVGEDIAQQLILGGINTFESWDKRSKDYKKWSQEQGDRLGDEGEKIFFNMDKNLSTSSKKYFHDIQKAGKHLDHALVKKGKSADESYSQTGRKVSKGFSSFGNAADDSFSYFGDKSDRDLWKMAEFLNRKSETSAKNRLSKSKESFVRGYLSFPEKLKQNGKNIKESLRHFTSAYSKSNEFRKKYSHISTVMWKNSWSDIKTDIDKSYQLMKKDLAKNKGTLGAIKALSWVTKMIFWDASLRPLSRLTVSGVGYLSVNALAFPTLLIIHNGVASSQVAIEVVKSTGRGAYDLTGPTVKAALGGVFSLLEYTGGKSAALLAIGASRPLKYGLKLTGKMTKGLAKLLGGSLNYLSKGEGKVIRAGTWGSGKVLRASSLIAAPAVGGVIMASGKILHGSGYMATQISKAVLKGSGYGVRGLSYTGAYLIKKGSHVPARALEYTTKGVGRGAAASINYVGVSLVAVGLPTVATGVGVAVGAVGVTTSAAYFSAGESIAGSTYVLGNTLSAATGTVGSLASLGAGGAVAGYEVVKGLTVPSGYIMGSGVVLTYGSLVHLGAQSILAVADASYLVLSLEGPRWVIYAIKGKLNFDDDYSQGTILDLQKMKAKGEEFQVVPVSNEEMENVIKSVHGHKP